VSPEDSTSDRVHFEFKQIDQELQIIKRINVIRRTSDMDDIQIRAAASSLHSIYNGVEKILVFMLKDRSLPPERSTSWHSEVLDLATHNRLISEKLADELRDYMGFRHFYRHNYGFMLDGELLKPLLDRIINTVSELKRQIGT